MRSNAWRTILSIVVILVLPFIASGAEPVGLMDAYRMALENDARLGAAREENRASGEEAEKALAQLRPNIRLGAARGRNRTTESSLYRDNYEQLYNTINYSATIRQPVLNISSINAYQQAKAIASKSDAVFRGESSTLIVRVLEAYCNVLYADDTCFFSDAHVAAAGAQFKQAQLRYEKGFGSLTEVNEAKAAHDMALADQIAGRHQQEHARRVMQELTGVSVDTLRGLKPELLSLDRPDPDTLSLWIERALSENHVVQAAQFGVRIASKDVAKRRAARYPVIDLVAGRTYSQSENNYTIGSIYDTYSISLQASMLLYSGGYTSADVRQAEAGRRQAEEELLGSKRSIETEVRRYYNGVVSSIAQVHAYQQAVQANTIALEGTRKGFAVGLRSNIDVLDAQKRLFDSKRSLAKARYEYLLNKVNLRGVSGCLRMSDLEAVSALML